MEVVEENDENVPNTPPDVRETAAEAREKSLLPSKSSMQYKVAYDKFLEWFRGLSGVNENTKITETFLMTYFETKISAASCWSIYSRLKSTLQLYDKISLDKMENLQKLLKRKAESHTPVQAPTFSSEQIQEFLKDAPDDGRNFIKKMALLFGLSGGLRLDELTNLTRDDVTKEGGESGFLKVNIVDSKTGPRHFYIHPNANDHLNAVKMYEKYLAMVPETIKSRRIWLRMENGKIQDRPLGKNNLADITKEIARFLKLPKPESYTSHSIRRTGATILAETNFTTEAIRQYGGWKNASTAQLYIENTANNKKRLSEAVIEPSTAAKKPFSPTPTPPALGTPQQPLITPHSTTTTSMFTQATLNNCVIHIHQ